MNSLLQISALVGVGLPIIVSLVKAQHWSAKVKSFIGLATSVGAAVLTSWVTGKLHGLDVAESFAVIYAATQTSYLAFWKPTGADGWLQQIGFTFPQPPPAPPGPAAARKPPAD